MKFWRTLCSFKGSKSTVNQAPAVGFYADYSLDSNGLPQAATSGHQYEVQEMFGKLDLHELDRVAVLINLGYVLKDGRDLQIRLCLEQTAG